MNEPPRIKPGSTTLGRARLGWVVVFTLSAVKVQPERATVSFSFILKVSILLFIRRYCLSESEKCRMTHLIESGGIVSLCAN